MAKELGFKPKSLMKNIPSPSQRWKMPVKQWIRELHEERFGRRTGGTKPKPTSPDRDESMFVRMPNPADDAHEERWLSPEEDDQDEFQALAEAMLPQVEFVVPLQMDPNDPGFEQQRLGRRQKNVCWAACSLTMRLREVPAVDRITLFGSVATSVRRPFGQPWSGPEGLAVCHTLNLAVWVAAWDAATLCTLDLIVRQTLLSLRDVERIILEDERVEVILIESGTDRFLGRLRRCDPQTAAPFLEIPPEYVFRLEPLREPQAFHLFDRIATPPPEPPTDDADTDVPF